MTTHFRNKVIGSLVVVGLSQAVLAAVDCPSPITGDKAVTTIARLSSQHTVVKPNPIKYILPQVLAAMQKTNSKPFLVDVRNPDLFAQTHIPGSLNIPGFAIRTKTYLKNRALVLIDEGYSRLELAHTASSLIAAGFNSVSILDGGLNYWRQSGLKLNGAVLAQAAIQRIPAKQHAQAVSSDWLVVDISGAKNALFPGNSMSIPYKTDKDGFAAKLRNLIAQQKQGGLITVLIVDEAGETFMDLHKRTKSITTANIFFLENGIKAYHGFLRNQKMMTQGSMRLTSRQQEGGQCR